MYKKGGMNSRGNEQVHILTELEELWLQMPSLRFMQFIEGVTGCKGTSGGGCNFYMSDDEFLQRLEKFSRQQYTDNYYEKNSPIHGQ